MTKASFFFFGFPLGLSLSFLSPLCAQRGLVFMVYSVSVLGYTCL